MASFPVVPYRAGVSGPRNGADGNRAPVGSLRWSSASAGHPTPCSAWTGHPPPGDPRCALWWLTLHGSGPLSSQWQRSTGALGALLQQAGLGAPGPQGCQWCLLQGWGSRAVSGLGLGLCLFRHSSSSGGFHHTHRTALFSLFFLATWSLCCLCWTRLCHRFAFGTAFCRLLFLRLLFGRRRLRDRWQLTERTERRGLPEGLMALGLYPATPSRDPGETPRAHPDPEPAGSPVLLLDTSFFLWFLLLRRLFHQKGDLDPAGERWQFGTFLWNWQGEISSEETDCGPAGPATRRAAQACPKAPEGAALLPSQVQRPSVPRAQLLLSGVQLCYSATALMALLWERGAGWCL